MNNHAKLGLLLPAVLNSATAAVVGIGLIAVGLYRLLPDDEEEVTVEAVLGQKDSVQGWFRAQIRHKPVQRSEHRPRRSLLMLSALCVH